jgi:hypothetical protein
MRQLIKRSNDMDEYDQKWERAQTEAAATKSSDSNSAPVIIKPSNQEADIQNMVKKIYQKQGLRSSTKETPNFECKDVEPEILTCIVIPVNNSPKSKADGKLVR